MNCKINYNYTFTPKTNITNVEINCWICPGRPGSAALGNCTVTATLQETQSSHCDESDVQSTIVNLHNNSHTVSSDAAHQNCDASVTAAALNGRKLTPPASERKKMMTNLIKRPPVDIRYENLVKNLFQNMFFRTNQVFCITEVWSNMPLRLEYSGKASNSLTTVSNNSLGFLYEITDLCNNGAIN